MCMFCEKKVRLKSNEINVLSTESDKYCSLESELLRTLLLFIDGLFNDGISSEYTLYTPFDRVVGRARGENISIWSE